MAGLERRVIEHRCVLEAVGLPPATARSLERRVDAALRRRQLLELPALARDPCPQADGVDRRADLLRERDVAETVAVLVEVRAHDRGEVVFIADAIHGA